jgi:hypothetical protein
VAPSLLLLGVFVGAVASALVTAANLTSAVLGWTGMLAVGIAPYLAVAVLGFELVARLCRRGRERAGARLLGVLAFSSLIAGAWAVVEAALFLRPGAALEAYTATCSHPLSRLPVVIVEGDCHYLCTVAARGHARLVRPQRIGRRRGQPIVVNRQLAVANAFEDLLHQRWPRLGRLARATYDRLGYPVSRHIRSRLVADLIYLAMKPAEWAFTLALLLLDPGSPEARIDRMYR